ncbi:dihydroneopterin triphosphate 2'-epimerase [Arhodomonas aquaeolei]|uniref:dihydroneopterin triphosphate 2'-epimerase n=1 Tax=Arhodomonas aquaeolei TaxID=2369 RepID=UPI00037ADF16|nr:dihydroneopterin triphosphate 2'-epimerase [Arhodomonas aquaeolei]
MRHELSRIRIKDLRLRTFIGFNTEEQEKRQDVVVNVTIDYDALPAARSDDVDHALDYKGITKRIIAHVEDNRFLLLEKLVSDILDIAMAPPEVRRAEVEVDKPHALRFSDSVSLAMAAHRDDDAR